MSTLRELKGRIGSVASTQKTTSAMKMISSAKMVKAVAQVQRLLPYRNMVHGLLAHLLGTDVEFSSPLLEEREVARLAIVVMGSDDGLCGAFNMNIFKQLTTIVDEACAAHGKQLRIDIYPVGKKMRKAVAKLASKTVTVQETPIDTRSNGDQLHDFTELLRQRFVDHEVDAVKVVYMHYVSSSRQRLSVEQLLPISPQALSEAAATVKNPCEPCLFEPDANTIFNSVLPLHLRATMQDIFTESTASEQASRVMAMQTASDNAAELLDELNLEYNKLRQQSITTELLDILGGQVER
ncbi:MAG: ATP synthase F1 subunit gamma [Muribaculaceae bacterium]|nr:ATP synthase F1 subunit gamma [Muribaculaceae bacterium]